MEQKILPVVYSSFSLDCLQAIYDYGAETFSPLLSEKFILGLIESVDALESTYLQHAECRYLPTKSRKYRMFAFVSYNIIYRVTKERIEVLAIIHTSRSIATIRSARRIRT